MNSEQDRQINQMIRFIQQEAAEKAEEIQEDAKSKQILLQSSETKKRELILVEKFKEMAAKATVERVIAKSRVDSKFKVVTMRARDEKVNEVKAAALVRLADASQSPQYGDLMTALIVEGLCRMQERKVTVRFREMDRAVAEAAIPQAQAQFIALLKEHTGVDVAVELTPDTEYLHGPHEEGKLGCCGGVELHAHRRQMILRNTIDSRLDIAFYQLKPSLRALLFGERAAPEQGFVDLVHKHVGH